MSPEPWATEADLKAASDFIHEWINEEAKLHGTSHLRVVRDALAKLIHDQRQAALKEGLTLTVEGLGFKDSTEPIVLISGASEQHVLEAFARGRRDGYVLCQNALQALLVKWLRMNPPSGDVPRYSGQPVDVLHECIDALARVQPPVNGVEVGTREQAPQ